MCWPPNDDKNRLSAPSPPEHTEGGLVALSQTVSLGDGRPTTVLAAVPLLPETDVCLFENATRRMFLWLSTPIKRQLRAPHQRAHHCTAPAARSSQEFRRVPVVQQRLSHNANCPERREDSGSNASTKLRACPLTEGHQHFTRVMLQELVQQSTPIDTQQRRKARRTSGLCCCWIGHAHWQKHLRRADKLSLMASCTGQASSYRPHTAMQVGTDREDTWEWVICVRGFCVKSESPPHKPSTLHAEL